MAKIYCFTSTGNSLYAAQKIAERMNGDVRSMRQAGIVCHDTVIGFVFPTYFWGLPRRVTRFIEELEVTDKNAYVFAVVTSGGYTPGVLIWLKQLLRSKGIRLHYGVRVTSVSNYTPEYEPKDSEALRSSIDGIILKIADDIKNRKKTPFIGIVLPNKLIYRLCPNEKSDRFFTVSPSCTGCATCAQVCPVGNIVSKSGRPQFAHHCEHCLACLHHCPAEAIDWNQKTQGKARYRNAGIPLEELVAFQHNHRRR